MACCRCYVVAGLGQGRARSAGHEAGGAARERLHRGHSMFSASVTGSPVSSRAPTALAICGVAPAPARASGARRASAVSCVAEGLEVARQGRGEDDEVRVPRVDRPGQLLDRGAHPEIVDPPPLRYSTMPKTNQRQVAKLPRGAGQDGAGAVPVPPAPGQPGEPPADDVAGEVLLGDAGRSPLPALPELGEIGTTTSRSTGVREKSDTSRSRTACAVGSSKASRACRRAPDSSLAAAGTRSGPAARPWPGPAVLVRAPLAPPRRPTARGRGEPASGGPAARPPRSTAGSRPLCAPAGGGRSGPPTPAGRGPSRRGAGSAHRCAAAASLRERRCKHSTILRQTFDKVARESYRHT